jgi:hypothetical protein
MVQNADSLILWASAALPALQQRIAATQRAVAATRERLSSLEAAKRHRQ